MTKLCGPAIALLLEKVIIGTAAAPAIGLTAAAEVENSGPRISSAPSARAASAAAAAPSGVPRVSRITKAKRSPARSKRASSAALRIAWPTSARAPLSGNSKPTLTCGGAAGGSGSTASASGSGGVSPGSAAAGVSGTLGGCASGAGVGTLGAAQAASVKASPAASKDRHPMNPVVGAKSRRGPDVSKTKETSIRSGERRA